MNPRSNDSPSRIRLVLKWTLGLPAALLLVITIGIAARYIPSKARLDRMQGARGGHVGRAVSIEFEPVVPNWIRKVVGAERCEPLDRIKAMYLSDVTDNDLIKWRGCYDAESVVVNSLVPITDRGLSLLAELQILKSLEIRGGRFTGKGMRALANCPNLTVLKLEEVELSLDWSDAIPGFSNLKHFEIEKVKQDQITVREVHALAAIPSLRSIRLNSSNWKNVGGPLAPLDDSPTGRTWRIAVKDLTREFTEPLAEIPNLDTLVISCLESMTSDSQRPLARLPSLRRLQISGLDENTEHHLSMLAGCPKLESLEIAWRTESNELDDHGLDHLAGVPSLAELIVHGRPSAKDFDGLAHLSNLQALRIEDLSYGIEIQGIDRLKSLVNLEEFDLYDGFVTGKNLDIILSMPKLHWLQFSTGATIPHHLQELVQHSELPMALKATFPAALHALEVQARDPEWKDSSITLSMGQRIRLPGDWNERRGIH